MTYNTRGAHKREYPELMRLFKTAFKEDEAELFDFLVRNDSALTSDSIRVATVDDRAVACSVVLARQIRTPLGTWIPGAIITLVACDPRYQGRGFGSAAVRDSLMYAAKSGANLAILYGHPGYYPRFGFVPVLPAVITILDVNPMLFRSSERGVVTGSTGPAESCYSVSDTPDICGTESDGSLQAREVQNSDIPLLADLYESQLANHPCSVRRDASPWIWRPRGAMAGRSVLVFCSNEPEQLIGYAFCMDNPNEGYLAVVEAAVSDKGFGSSIVGELARRAGNLGRRYLRINLTPGSPIVQAALYEGATQEYRPAAAGMACVLRWDALLPGGYEIRMSECEVEQGLSTQRDGRLQNSRYLRRTPPDCLSPDDSFYLLNQGYPVLTAKRGPLTRLVLGCEDADSLIENGSLKFLGNTMSLPSTICSNRDSRDSIDSPGSLDSPGQLESPDLPDAPSLFGPESIRDLPCKDFRKSFPKWYLAPYWY